VTTASSIATQDHSTKAAAVAYDHVMRARILTTKSGTDVTVVVREMRNGRVIQERREDATLVAGEPNKLSMLVRSAYARPDFQVRLMNDGLAPGEGLALERVRWTSRGTGDDGGDGGGDPENPPTPDPENPPTPDPENPPTPDPEDPPTDEPDGQSGTLSNGCSYSARGIPACGAYLGQTYGANADPTEFESDMGRRLGVHRTFYRADQVSSAVKMAEKDLAEGRLPWVSFKLPYGWGEMAAGQGDNWARDLAQKMGRLDGPVWLAFHHEPEYDGVISQWTRMQERLGPIVRSQDNLAFTVIVTGYHQFYGEDQFALSQMWPKGMKVDVAGFDIYNQMGVVKDGKENTKGTNLQEAYFSKIQPWAEKEGLVWGLGETGITHDAIKTDPDWIERTYKQLDAAGGVAFAYFNTTLNSIAPWTLDTPEKLAGWRDAQVGSPLLPKS
jgi:hypothetical protein